MRDSDLSPERRVQRIWSSRIGRRMAILIIGFSSLITLGIVVIQLFGEYRDLRNDLDNRFESVSIFLPSISSSVWNYDDEHVQTFIEGFLKLPFIERVEISASDSARFWSAGKEISENTLSRSYELWIEIDNKRRLIGTLQIVASIDAMYRQVANHAISIALSNGFKTLCVALFMLYLFRRLVTTRLDLLSEKIATLAPRLTHGVEIAGGCESGMGDELDSVEQVIDRTAAELAHATRQREVDQAALRESEARFRILVEQAPEAILVLDTEAGHLIDVNPQAEALLGCRRDELLEGTVNRFYAEEQFDGMTLEERRTVAFSQVARGMEYRTELNVRTADGRPLICELSLISLPSAGRSLMRISLVDVTPRKRAEAELRELNLQLDQRVRDRTAALQSAMENLRQTQEKLIQSEKLVALGSIVNGVAHEMNTPIGTCLTVASTLEATTRNLAEQVASGNVRKSQFSEFLDDTREAVGLLIKNLDRSIALIENFKRVAAVQDQSNRKLFPLGDVIDDVIAMLESRLQATPYTLSVTVDKQIRMDSYPAPVEQIVSSLVDNALVHAFVGRAHGHISLIATPIDLDGREAVRIEFKDDGLGMTEEVRKRVFEPFFTTQLGGGTSGLGMSVCYNLITGPLGGSVVLSSTPGEGTTFVVDLPCVAPRDISAKEK